MSIPRDPYACTGPAGDHTVTADNPMCSGRCMACRAFVVFVRSRNRWRWSTPRLALRRGYVGARR